MNDDILLKLVSLKLLMALFIVIGVFFIIKKYKFSYFLIFAGLCYSLSYYIIMKGFSLLLWGLQGDEVTIAAIFNTFAHIGMYSDFSYHNLPPFYPPLFFWFFSVFGKIFNLNGVSIAKLATFISLFFLPIFLYWLNNFFRKKIDNNGKFFGIAGFLFPLFIFFLIDNDVLFGKPYEVITAAICAIWFSYIIIDLKNDKLSNAKIFIYGALGAVIFMTYYLWFIFSVIAISLYALFTPDEWRIKNYISAAKIGILTMIFSLPYLGPLIYSYIKNGTENWQFASLTAKGLAVNFTITDFTLVGFISLIGLVGLIYFRNNKFVRPSLFLYATSYVWWIMGLILLYFFNTPFQEFRGFGIFDRVILAFSLSNSIELVLLKNEKSAIIKKFAQIFLIIGILFLAAQMPFGKFSNEDLIIDRMSKSKNMLPSYEPLINYIKNDPSAGDKLTLHSGIAELAVFRPINSFIYFNQHNNHPASHFSSRKAYLYIMAGARTPEEFHKLMNSPYGKIERLIFFKGENYSIFLHVDSPGLGIKIEEIKIAKKLITSDFFSEVYNDKNYIIFDTK